MSQSDRFDSWADDVPEVNPGELPVRLQALADNNAPELPNEGNARRRRLDKMQNEINECAAFVEDCDRLKDGIEATMTVRSEAKTLILGDLLRKRRRAFDRGRTLTAELRYLHHQTGA